MDEPGSEHDKERIERLRRAMYSRELSEKLKERPRRALEDIRPVVGEEWKHDESELPMTVVAPRAIAVARSALWWILGIAAIFFVGAILFFIYYFTFGGGGSPASARNIDIVISGPPQISGGEPTQLQITVTNRNQIPLQLADLVIIYPPGTRSPTDLSTDLASQRIPLGTIEPGGRRQGTVSAIFAGGATDVRIRAELEYRIAGSSAIFVASSDYQALTSASSLGLSIAGNTETVSGQPVELVITVASNANTTVKDVLLETSYPFGFTFSSANPAPVREGVWQLGDIAPGQRKEIIVRGTLVGEIGDERVFRFSAGTRKSTSEQSITTLLSDNSVKMRVAEPFLGLSLTVNKSSGSNVVVAPGTNVAVAVNWQNNLSTPIQDAVIVARLSGVEIDGATVISPDGFYRSGDGVVIWDKTTTNGALANIPAGARGSVSFTFQMPASEALSSVRNPSLTFTINASGKRIAESGVPQNLQSTATQRAVVSSDLRVTAQGLYYANPFTSTGPLPPKAGSETTYGIVFTLTNTTNRMTNGKLSATLPSYVRWVGIYSPASEHLEFNHTDSTVTWDIGTIEPGVGMDGSLPRQAAIAIGFTPSTSQIGQEPPLLLNISFSGIDSATSDTVTRSVQNVTTNIVGDPGFNPTQATVVR